MAKFRVRENRGEVCNVYVVNEVDRVALKFEDVDGDDWYIGYISEKGLELCSSIGKSSGLAVDKQGRTVVTNGD